MKRTGPACGAGPAGFKRLMKRLGNPQDTYKIIHVAGTNGKGSICYLCAEILKSAGYKTGLFLSPHLHSPVERIQINNLPITNRDFVCACQRVLDAEVEKLNFFEILTAAAFLYFAEKKVQWIVLETGLGGKKDPTNICKPMACVISSIGLDHCQILGNTLTKIAHEKAGVIKPSVPIFCPPLPREVLRVIKQKARCKKAPLTVGKKDVPFKLARVNWKNQNMILKKGKSIWCLHLLGEKQVQNACLVYQLCRLLKISDQTIKKGFATVQVPGRFEIIKIRKKTIILDGAHNPQAVENLLQFLQKSPYNAHSAVVCGFMKDKDYPLMMRAFAKYASKLYLTVLDGPRSANLTQLKNATPVAVQASYFKSPKPALRCALCEHSTVLVSGSFYLASQLRGSRLRARGARRD